MSPPPSAGPPPGDSASRAGWEFDPELGPVEERLHAERPVPRAAFRTELRARLIVVPRERGRARGLILAYATSGLALLVVATLGVAGAGPLAAG